MQSVWLDQVLVKFLIYHAIIVATSESQQSSDLMQLVPDVMHYKTNCVFFFTAVSGETETIIHRVCAPFNNVAMPHAALVSGVRWSCQAKSSSAYINTHTHIICHPSVFSAAGRQSPHHSSLSISFGDSLIMSSTDEEWDIHHCTHHCFHTDKHSELTHTHTHIYIHSDFTLCEI